MIEIDCDITKHPIDVGGLYERAVDERCGAVSMFVGTARTTSSARTEGRVTRLEYEAYAPMALRELEGIAEEAARRFGALRVIVRHRVGRLDIGESAVAILVATPHRASAFDACRFLIEELKLRVPIWKKEVFDDGEEWINARP